MIHAPDSIQRHIYSVSELTAEIKEFLEDQYPFVWLTGEISNFRAPGSGHFYFTLKDAGAQIGAVMFKGQNRNLKFRPEDRMKITGFGRIGVYPPRGNYQIILEYLEPRGVGELHLAFEQLKARLQAEGLFDSAHKKDLPVLPAKIGVVTSPTGAAIHDILRVIGRRYPNMPVEIAPARVQGDGADLEIAAALALVDRQPDTEVILLARGGGSLEDLQAFNAEAVARAIFACRVPVISGVGHETDVTIADFVADVRAPTPSAAAEMAVPVKAELRAWKDSATQALAGALERRADRERRALTALARRLVHPRRRVQDWRLRVDDLRGRLGRSLEHAAGHRRERLAWRTERLRANSPVVAARRAAERLDGRRSALPAAMGLRLRELRARTAELSARLRALNPHGVLERGYAIARSSPDGAVVRSAGELNVGQLVDIRVARGRFRARVEEIAADDGETDV
jgi:exodeoxyribonuclease VII large subunit